MNLTKLIGRVVVDMDEPPKILGELIGIDASEDGGGRFLIVETQRGAQLYELSAWRSSVLFCRSQEEAERAVKEIIEEKRIEEEEAAKVLAEIRARREAAAAGDDETEASDAA